MKLGYARVSTTGQNLEAQIAALWAAGVEKIYQDKASGKDRNHPALKEMLDFARQGDEIVVARLDRFTRSSADAKAPNSARQSGASKRSKIEASSSHPFPLAG